jgi:hypothetical protein
LTSAYPSFEEVKSEWGPSIKIAEMIVNKVARGEPPRDELVEVTKIFYYLRRLLRSALMRDLNMYLVLG